MSFLRSCLWIFVVVMLGFTIAGCQSKDEPQPEPEAEEEPLLLLLDEDVLTDRTGLNDRCYVCHVNFSHEELAVNHALVDVGCEDCHGSCDAHCDDEDNITPPDIMYAEEQVNEFCMGCHPVEDLEGVDKHDRIVAGSDNQKTCTTCHGKHRVNYRTREWDPYTGELIQDDDVRMM